MVTIDLSNIVITRSTCMSIVTVIVFDIMNSGKLTLPWPERGVRITIYILKIEYLRYVQMIMYIFYRLIHVLCSQLGIAASFA